MTEPVEAQQPFSAVLRGAGRQDHSEAESTGFISALMAGRLPRADYAALTAQLYFVYAALEGAAERLSSDPVAGRFVLPELTRLPSLARDLEELLGADWAERITPLAATTAYVRRLQDVNAATFVAHHYTRYLGDLSGGQIIGRGIEQAYGLDGPGVLFYRFAEIPEPKAFKDGYRTLLDGAPFSDADKARILAEVKVAYRLNTELLRDLGDQVGDQVGATA